jgi:hypothetical protein
MKADRGETILKWIFIIGTLTGILYVLVSGINRQYEHYQESKRVEDSIKAERSVEILKKAMRTGFIDTTGTGQGINVMSVDSNRY